MKSIVFIYLLFPLILLCNFCGAQISKDSTKLHGPLKNVIRYNLSGALFFGANRCIILGYERVIRRNQSISVNFGKISLPRLVSVNTGDLFLESDKKNSGMNFSIDYRFYLPKENKHAPPHGLYIGPYYSFNEFKRENVWTSKNNSNNHISTRTEVAIHTMGFELGYQIILWKRMTIDFLLVGPGLGRYTVDASIDNDLDEETQQALADGLNQIITQRFPGMNYVFSDKRIDTNGSLKVTSLGYRYIIHAGFNF